MGLRDIIKKKEDLQEAGDHAYNDHLKQQQHLGTPEFVFVRSDTATHEIIQPPSDPVPNESQGPPSRHLSTKEPSRARRSLDVFRSRGSRSASVSSNVSSGSHDSRRSVSGASHRPDSLSRKLSSRLHIRHEPESSEYVPEDLPEIIAPADAEGDESQWEKRATMLADQNERARSRPASRPGTPNAPVSNERLMQMRSEAGAGLRRGSESRPISSQAIDEDIQAAIRLHESGDLERSTRIFGRLADPDGANNPLSQVLYGLALRHGWGCQPDPAQAVKYLTAAASNSASVEQLALQAGMKKGGAAKGELVLAIFELANCFRHGWGIGKDAVAAKQYYETAANLGDTDAMNEVAWCYLEGYGCKKDKMASARYYRLAEKAGNKTLGNSWIWKEKYDPPGESSKAK